MIKVSKSVCPSWPNSIYSPKWLTSRYLVEGQPDQALDPWFEPMLTGPIPPPSHCTATTCPIVQMLPLRVQWLTAKAIGPSNQTGRFILGGLCMKK